MHIHANSQLGRNCYYWNVGFFFRYPVWIVFGSEKFCTKLGIVILHFHAESQFDRNCNQRSIEYFFSNILLGHSYCSGDVINYLLSLKLIFNIKNLNSVSFMEKMDNFFHILLEFSRILVKFQSNLYFEMIRKAKLNEWPHLRNPWLDFAHTNIWYGYFYFRL